MHRLEDQYKDKIDFIYLNVERQDTLDARQRFDIINRSQYILIDAQGNVISRWFGFLDEEAVTKALDDFLATS